MLKSVPLEKLDEEARSLAVTIAEGAPEAVRLTKRALRRAVAFDPRRGRRRGVHRASGLCSDPDDSREELTASFEKRHAGISRAMSAKAIDAARYAVAAVSALVARRRSPS